MRPGQPRSVQKCYLGRQIDRSTGKTLWRITVSPDPDSKAIALLENEADGGKGRFEVLCEQKQVGLLGVTKGSKPFTSVDWLNDSRTGMEDLPEEYKTQLLGLCRQESQPQTGTQVRPGQ